MTKIPAVKTKQTSSPETLGGLFGIWWNQKGRLMKWLGGGVFVAIAVMAAFYFLRPTQREGRLEVRLLFNGVEQGLYPNGTRFTLADLIAEPVLQEVYKRHQLEKNLTFGDFRNAFAVLHHNAALDGLRLDYAGQLEDKSLSQVERSKVEEEYESRRRALRNGDCVLVIKPALENWPSALTAAVAGDILKVWEEQARHRGAFKFNLDIYSANIVSDIAPYRDDYMVLLDRIRVTISRILGNIDDLEAIPGAPLVRAGDRKVSLGELKALLRDDLRYKLTLIESPVYGLGMYRNRAFSQAYIEEQLFRLSRETASAKRNSAAVEQALTSYAASGVHPSSVGGTSATGAAGAMGSGNALIPQISESFLNRMLDMSSQQSDVTFRQNLAKRTVGFGNELADIENERQIYENMLRLLNSPNPDMEEQREAMQGWVARQTAALLKTLEQALGDTGLLYEEISRRSLEPPVVYSVTEPFYLARASALSLGRVAVVIILMSAAYAAFVLYLTACGTAKTKSA
jgi:hypothetical protein